MLTRRDISKIGDDVENLAGLIAGDKAAWDGFVTRFAGLILAAVRRVVGPQGEVEDIAQDVFIRLCKDDYRLLRQYDPARAALSTWLTIVARSVAHDSIRRRRIATQQIDETPETYRAVNAIEPERLRIPEGLLSPRQSLILSMLYDRDMEVAEIADALSI